VRDEAHRTFQELLVEALGGDSLRFLGKLYREIS
jgi:hypothetical protein